MELRQRMEGIRRDLEALEGEIAKVVVGQKEVIELLLTALLADGHVLLEGLPGLGKTLIAKTLKEVLQLSYSRIQFTPDLMPADITGTNVIDVVGRGEKSFRFEPGPIFANLLLADEINRASPKTQSALLQAMQEREVTVFGHHYRLEEPFYTIATQNPIEVAGTYPLPEAQLDRFMFKVTVRMPGNEDLARIGARTTAPDAAVPAKVLDRRRLLEMKDAIARIPVAEAVMNFAAGLVLATHPRRKDSPQPAVKFVRYGASPRALQAMVSAGKVAAARDGRFNVSREDILRHFLPVMRHRVILNFEGELQKMDIDTLLSELAGAHAPAGR